MGTIGNLSVKIGGDASGFKDTMSAVSNSLKGVAGDFDSLVATAVAGGATLGEAIKSALAVPDTSQINGAFASVGDAAAAAAAQLDLFSQSAHVDYSDATGQLNLFATELESLGPSAAQAAGGLMQIPTALDTVNEKTNEAGSLFQDFGEKVSAILEHPIQQFRNLVEAIGPVGIGMAAVGAAVVELGAKITELVLEEGSAARETQNLADKLNLTYDQTKLLGEMGDVVGVSIDSLSRASMRLAQALDDPTSAAGKKVTVALEQMGIQATDSGDALMKLLEHLATIPDATERISLAFTVMGRGAVQLEPLLNNYEDLKTAVEQLGGALDTQGVQKLLDANKAAGLLSIAWDHLKESMAATFAPAVTEAIKMLTALLTGPPPITLDQQIASLKQEIADLGVQAADTQHHLSSMFAASTGMVGPEATPDTLGQRQTDLDILQSQKDAIARSKEYNAELDASNANQKKWAADGAAAFAAMEKAETEFHNSAVTLWNSLPASYDQYLSNLQDGGKTAKSIMDSIETDLNRASTVMLGMKGAPLQAMQEWVDGLKSAQATMQQFAATDNFYQAAGKIGMVIDKFPTQVQELSDMDAGLKQFFDTMKQGAADVPDALNKISIDALATKLLESQKQLDDSGQKLQDTFTKFYDQYEQRTRTAIGITDDFKVKFGELAAIDVSKELMLLPPAILAAYNNAVLLNSEAKALGITIDQDGNTSKKLVDDFNAIASNGNTSLETVQLAWGKISGQISKIATTDLPYAIAEYQKAIDALKAKGGALGDIIALEEKQIADEIKYNELRGIDSTAEIERLTQLQYQNKALMDASTALGNVYVGVRKAFDDAFASLSKGLADAIVNGKNLGDVFVNVGKQIATSILDTVIKGALVPLQDELNKTGGLFDTLGKAITGGLRNIIPGLGGGGSGSDFGNIPGIGGAAGGGSGYSSDIGTAGVGGNAGVDLGAAGGGADSSGGGLSSLFGSSTGSILGFAGLGVSIASGIVQGIQGAHLNNLMGEIEVTTRQIANVVALNGQETIFAYSKLTWQDLQTMVGELSDLHNDNVDVISLLQAQAGGAGPNPVVAELHNVEDRISSVRDAIAQLISTVETSGGTSSSQSVNDGSRSVSNALVSHSQSMSGLHIIYPNGPGSTDTSVGSLGSPVSKKFPNSAPYDPLTFLLQQAMQANPGGSPGSIFQSPLSFAGMSPDSQAALMSATDVSFTLPTGNPYTNPLQSPGWRPDNGFQTALNSITGPAGYGPIDPSQIGAMLVNIQNQLSADLSSGRTDTVATNAEQYLAQLIIKLQNMGGLNPGGPWNIGSGDMSGIAPSPPAIPMNAIVPGIAFNPIGNYGGGPGSGLPITVNALNPSSRGVADGIVVALRQIGVKVS